mmetsp:Transcript_31307/g.99792  ORF Transcript_31307/g.99792 Transcript_31307/m.99792 type:complete len:285 (-) Transcript_31307:384-1238(-)
MAVCDYRQSDGRDQAASRDPCGRLSLHAVGVPEDVPRQRQRRQVLRHTEKPYRRWAVLVRGAGERMGRQLGRDGERIPEAFAAAARARSVDPGPRRSRAVLTQLARLVRRHVPWPDAQRVARLPHAGQRAVQRRVRDDQLSRLRHEHCGHLRRRHRHRVPMPQRDEDARAELHGGRERRSRLVRFCGRGRARERLEADCGALAHADLRGRVRRGRVQDLGRIAPGGHGGLRAGQQGERRPLRPYALGPAHGLRQGAAHPGRRGQLGHTDAPEASVRARPRHLHH